MVTCRAAASGERPDRGESVFVDSSPRAQPNPAPLAQHLHASLRTAPAPNESERRRNACSAPVAPDQAALPRPALLPCRFAFCNARQRPAQPRLESILAYPSLHLLPLFIPLPPHHLPSPLISHRVPSSSPSSLPSGSTSSSRPRPGRERERER